MTRAGWFFAVLLVALLPEPLYSCEAQVTRAIKSGEAAELTQVAKRIGLDATCEDERGNTRTALTIAAESGELWAIRLLLELGASPNVHSDDGASALILASNRGHAEVVAALVEAGANLNHQVRFGATALINAATQGHREVVEILLKHGADTSLEMRTPLDRSASTALSLAAQEGHEDIVDLILSAQGHDGPRPPEVERLLEESRKNRTYISGTLIENQQDHLLVESFGTRYRFPIQEWTEVVDREGKEIPITSLVIGEPVSVAINRDRVLRVIKGGVRVTLEPIE